MIKLPLHSISPPSRGIWIQLNVWSFVVFPIVSQKFKRGKKNTETSLLEKVCFEVFSLLSERTRSFFC